MPGQLATLPSTKAIIWGSARFCAASCKNQRKTAPEKRQPAEPPSFAEKGELPMPPYRGCLAVEAPDSNTDNLLPLNEVRRVMAAAIQPAHFFFAKPLMLEWPQCPT